MLNLIYVLLKLRLKLRLKYMQIKKTNNLFKIKQIPLIIFLSFSLGLSGCSHLYKQNPTDPFEKYNRSMFNFNTKLDEYIVGPITMVYTKVLPSFARKGVGNFFNNIDTIPDIANDLLQGNLKMAGNDTARLLLNTSFGVGGLFDIAKRGGLPGHSQSFGNTLYVWGWKDSAYFILPALGPSTIRGTVSLVPNSYMDPLGYVTPTWAKYSLKGLKYTQIASVQIPLQEKLVQMAIDPYVALRNAYMQNLSFRLKQDKSGNMANVAIPDETKDI